MKCPQCGYEIGTSHKCIRCGCEISSVATVDDNNQNKDKNEKHRAEEPSVKVIDPSQVYITESVDYEDSYDPIASLFDGFFGDPISDLLNMFGFGSPRGSRHRSAPPQSNEPEPKRRKQGKVVEFDDVEILDANNKTIYKKSNKNNNDKK